jgi:hypothetical protein
VVVARPAPAVFRNSLRCMVMLLGRIPSVLFCFVLCDAAPSLRDAQLFAKYKQRGAPFGKRVQYL